MDLRYSEVPEKSNWTSFVPHSEDDFDLWVWFQTESTAWGLLCPGIFPGRFLLEVADKVLVSKATSFFLLPALYNTMHFIL